MAPDPSGGVVLFDGDGQTWTIDDQPVPVDDDLALQNVPAAITTDATSPSGAIVSYTPPTAGDEGGETPTVGCDHTSGSTFGIGATTVTCTATDADDSNGPVTATFSVTVKGAVEQLTDLKAEVQGIGPGTSLSDKVTQAQSELASGKTAQACGTLGAFIKEVTAQKGKTIPAAQAAQLIASAQQIEAVIGC
jgi:hypothetical protein